MRTTLTLEADVAARLKRLMKQKKLTLKAAVNHVMRRGLAAAADEPQEREFRVEPHDGGLLPGIDPTKLGQLADELETVEQLRILQTPRS